MSDPSQPLDNARHERFAAEWAKGVSAAEAFRRAGFNDHPRNAGRLSKNEEVKARKVWLQKQASFADVLSIAESRHILATIARKKRSDPQPRIAAIRADADLAEYGAEAGLNKALEIIIRKL